MVLAPAACGGAAPSCPAASGKAAAGSPAQAGVPKMGGTIRVGLDSELANLDPIKSAIVVDRQVIYNMYESLAGIDGALGPLPGHARGPRRHDRLARRREERRRR